MRERLIPRIPAICVAVVISASSAHYFSGQQTAHVIFPILHRLFPSASAHLLRLIHVLIRKATHFIEFGAFSVAVFHGVRGDHPGWKLEWAVVTLCFAISDAGSNEWHQSFVPLR